MCNSYVTPYDVSTDDVAVELIDGLSDQEIRGLHATIKRLGLSGWMAWLKDHAEDVEQFLSASPAGRRRLSPGDAAERTLLALGALWLAQLGGAMGHWFHDRGLQGKDNDRYTRAVRGRLLWESRHVQIEFWPFDEPPDLDSPFLEE